MASKEEITPHLQWLIDRGAAFALGSPVSVPGPGIEACDGGGWIGFVVEGGKIGEACAGGEHSFTPIKGTASYRTVASDDAQKLRELMRDPTACGEIGVHLQRCVPVCG